ncbi:hypothetical protein AMS68_005052 [Peltaster fructicola]|uniref:Filamentation protein n=1 Tax=Peltaster fructicola TaxID=286661 RepID=A0A6H0XXZ8_9PEZI|nr:hypothetical protein AMS68_005052 [Peltaster fructicola]
MSVTGSIRISNAEKGVRYISLLDNALCNANWDDVPELTRKIEKHAPGRECLAIAARAEAKIATAGSGPASGTALKEVVDLVPQLDRAINSADASEEDTYIAAVALAKIYWVGKNHEAALRVLPDREPTPTADSSTPSCLGWLEICNVKITYIRISLLTALGRDHNIQDCFKQAISISSKTRSPELRKWTERLLAGVCFYYSEKALNSPSTYSMGESLRVFWAWNEFWSRSPTTPPAAQRGQLLRIDVPRLEVWRRYYELLSSILRYGLIYNLKAKVAEEVLTFPDEHFTPAQITEARLNQSRELKRIESTYETLLLSETKFPTATHNNTGIEEWVSHVIRNWKLMCGPMWSDAELGEGGKTAMGHTVLDVLYRAATKTFHSTTILRELFNVHTILGEFDLAMNAFDSYVEIIGKAKLRAAKTGKHELGFDDDDLALQTAADAVKILCRYGDSRQAEKALKIGEDIQKWLDAQSPTQQSEVDKHADDNYASSSKPLPRPTEQGVTAKTLAAAYRAIGQSKAQWARYTPATEQRASLQYQAIEELKRAEVQDPESIETAYALALALADTRDVSGAIATLRTILALHPTDTQEAEETGDWTKQRQLVPLWHLLALCLTAKDQNDAAMRMCQASFDQFGDATVLFGRPRSSREPELQNGHRVPHGLVDQMESLEKESIIQIKMTQLSFVELTDGPNIAVDMSDELLGLFTRLFGSPEQGRTFEKKASVEVEPPPTQPKSTLRSITGSIRIGNRHGDKLGRGLAAHTDGRQSAMSQRSTITGAPGSVMNDDGFSTHKRKPISSLKNRFISRHNRKESTVDSDQGRNDFALEKSYTNGDFSGSNGNSNNYSYNEKAVAPAIANADLGYKTEQPIEFNQNESHDHWPPPAGHEEEPPRQDVRMPTAHPAAAGAPELRLPSLHERRHKIGLLVQIWLFIAHLYLRADQLEEASGAIVEASKQAESLEVEIAAHDSSAKEFAARGWSSAKSIDELMADIWAANGDLAAARALPHKAMENYERALALYPNHASSIIDLADLLMDIYEEKIPAEDSKPLIPPLTATAGSLINIDGQIAPPETNAAFNPSAAIPQPRAFDKDPSPAALNRLAARDRAYMLLSALTRQGTGWDNPEAWYTLARAHELSKQVSKAKQALWWVVELEDNKPMRSWRSINAAGFTL